MSLDELLLALRSRAIVLTCEGERLSYDGPKGAMRPELLDALRRHKGALLERLRAPERDLALEIDPQRARWPLTAEQLRMWIADQIRPARAAYNMALVLRWEGSPGADELGEALAKIAERHPILATRVDLDGNVPAQILGAPPQLAVERIASEAVAECCAREAARAFELTREAPLRVRLFELEGDRRVSMVTLHHLAGDERSLELLVAELAAALGFGAGRREQAEVAGFGDYASWSRARFEPATPRAAALALAWAESLAGLEPLALGGMKASAGQLGAPEQLERRVDARTVARLDALALALGGSRFAVCCAALALVCGRWTRQRDIPLATPLSARRHAALVETVGPLLETAVVRVRLADARTPRELAAQVCATMIAALERGPAPLTEIARAGAEGQRDLGSLLRVLVTARGRGPTRVGGLEVAEHPRPTTKADLTVTIIDAGDGVSLRLEYEREQLGAEAPGLADALVRALEAFAERPDTPLDRLALLGEDQRRASLGWGQGAATPEFFPVIEAILSSARAHPDAIAVAGAGFELSYSCTLDAALRLAAWLGEQGLRAEDRVGVCLERGPWLVATILGVLAAGLVYVPLDPRLPPTRLRELSVRARAKLVLTEPALRSRLGTEVEIVLADQDAPWRRVRPRARPVSVAPEQLAYLIYTSGSSGRPKGVAITQRSVSALLQWVSGHMAADALDGVFAASSVAFDLSIFELLAPLHRGGTVILARDVLELPEHPQRRRVTLLNTVPSAAAALVDQLPEGLEHINLAGEPLRRELVARLSAGAPARRILNLYGPAEDTTYSTAGVVEPGAGPARLGAALPGTRVYLLDEAGPLAPAGALAHLHLAGVGLARGYDAEPGATALGFGPDPYGPPGARMYATGDLVRRRGADMVFESRCDRQVKVRGVRIEPGEIEAALAAVNGVAEVAVLARPRGAEATHLLALCRLVTGATVELEDLRARCRETLASSHVPRLHLVDALPRTASGKLDLPGLEALADELEHRAAELPTEEIAGPQNEAERVIRELWADLLELPVERLSVEGDLFALGAHSLLVPRFLNRLQRRFGVRLPVRAVFEQPSVRALAERLVAAQAAEDQALLELLDEVEQLSEAEVDRLLGDNVGDE